MTRQAIRYVEIDAPVCANTYGVAPCTASVPTTGADKCYNCVSTCQDSAHYIDTTDTVRFAEATGFNPDDIEAHPIIESVSFTPGRISLGQDLGQRSSVSVTFRDYQHSDAGPGLDPYHASRSYDPYAQGTFWGRWKARQPYIKGSELRLITGFVGDALADMEIRTFIVESFNGPGMDGRYTITAKDPLKLLDGDQAQAPALSTGYLSATLTSGGTSATLLPVGIGNSEYPASGYAAIGGKEIVSFTRSGDTLTITRAQYNTTAIAHAANDRVQVCAVWTAQDPADIIDDLMTTYGSVPSGYIPIADWQAETAAYLGQVYTGIVAEPTSVKTLIGELALQAGLAIWWDDLTAQIRLQVLRAISTDAELFDDASDKLGGTLQITEQPEQRVSQMWVYFAQRNPLDGQEDGNNYRSIEELVDVTAEINYGTSAIQKIFSRWIAVGGRSIASRLCQLQLGRFVAAPRKFNFDVFRRDGRDPVRLGGGYQIKAYPLQEADGTAETVPVQVTRLIPEKDRWSVEAEEVQFTNYSGSITNKTVIYDADVNARNGYDDCYNLYGAPSHGDTVNFIINAGVKLGSTGTSVASFNLGSSWPTITRSGDRTSGSPIITGLSSTTEFRAGQFITGVAGIPAQTKILSVDSPSQITLDKNATSGAATSTSLTIYTVIINITLNGTIDGAGGKGGQGRSESSGYISPTVGEAGGTAIYARYYANLAYGAASKLRGGGGGGGGSATGDGNDLVGGGGGGGAGVPGGAGGPSGTGTQTAEAGSAGTAETGGIGGRSWTKNVPWAFAGLDSNYRGGTGGNIGVAGSKGANQASHTGANGGAVGSAIDGVSYIKSSGTPASLLGGQVN